MEGQRISVIISNIKQIDESLSYTFASSKTIFKIKIIFIRYHFNEIDEIKFENVFEYSGLKVDL